MKVLYTPIDIPNVSCNVERMLDWFEENKIYDPEFWVFKDGRHEWALAAASHEPENWKRIKAYEDWLEQDHKPSEGAELVFAPGFEDACPEIARAIRTLPFVEIGAVGLLKQLKYIEPHRDTKDPNEPTEPRRYMIYLTDPAKNTFFLTDRFDEEQRYEVKINPDYPVFAFNNTDAKHGADAPLDTKILISVVGIIDEERHVDLINRSTQKFGDWVVRSDL